jgi:hypothetical protein
MGFTFAETMAGTVEWDAQPGIHHPFSIEVTAEAPSTREYLQHHKVTLRGVIHAPPLADTADVEGVITIRPIGQRVIRYELSFAGDDGKSYELIGQKDIRLRQLLHSFTYLPAEILDDEHRRVATCKTTFDFRRNGWAFLRSFRPL